MYKNTYTMLLERGRKKVKFNNLLIISKRHDHNIKYNDMWNDFNEDCVYF